MSEGTAAEAEGTISAAAEAYEKIEHMIVTGVLSEYELLSESDLARRTGCGRTPVREALQRLKFEGFVDILPRRGIMVTPVDITRQLELLEMRRPLEKLVVSLGAERATDEQRAEMRRLARDLDEAISNRDRSVYFAINRSIHVIEAEATHNRFLARQIQIVHNLSRRFWYSFITDADSFADAAKHHGATLVAISDGDSERAYNSSDNLMDLLEYVSRKAIDRMR